MDKQEIASPTLRTLWEILRSPRAYPAEAFVVAVGFAYAKAEAPFAGGSVMEWFNKFSENLGLIILHPLFLVAFGIWSIYMLYQVASDVEARKLKVAEKEASLIAQAMELPTLAVAVPAIAALLAELRAAVAAEKVNADGYILKLQSLASGEPVTHHRKTSILPRFEGEFRASASSIFGTGTLARPSPLTAPPHETSVPVVDAHPHLCYDPTDPANITFVREVQGKIAEVEHYKKKLDGIEREASRKFDALHRGFQEKAKNHAYSQLGSL